MPVDHSTNARKLRVLAWPAFSNEKVNPYNSLLYRELVAQGASVTEYSHKRALFERQDIAHFHWPDGYINQANILKSLQRLLLLVAVIYILKLKRTKIVWTVHNVAPHDAYRPGLSSRFLNWFAKHCDGFIFMSKANLEKFYERYGQTHLQSTALIPHGHYKSCYPIAPRQAAARQQLGIPVDHRVLLFFGMIKPYKNIPALMSVFNQAAIPNCTLVIAGNTEPPELRQEIIRLRNADTHLFLEFIADDQLPVYLSAADYVILPYKSILNSGALLLALSFNKPVIAPHMGAIITMQEELGASWIQSYTGELTPTNLQAAINHLDSNQRPLICPMDNYNWDVLANQTLAFYQQLLQIPGRREATTESV